MVAFLLYLIGLVAVLVSLAIIAYGAPNMVAAFSSGMDGGGNAADLTMRLLGQLGWAVTPIVGGLALMGLARIIMLLGSINRGIRGPN